MTNAIITVRKIVTENSLSIVLFLLFFVFLGGLAVSGYVHENEQLQQHGRSGESFGAFLVSPTFFEAVFENWESEFLQMAALVILTIWLVQKGAADSKRLKGKEDVDTSSRYSIIRAASWRTRKKAIGEMFYANSLSLALITLFIGSFLLHGVSGVAAANEEAAWHGGQQMTMLAYMSSAQFWFESFQNWQSEFLAVGTLLILSIFLRQRYSPESKPVGTPMKKTGS